MNKEKVKGFVGQHKKKLIAAGTIVGGVVIYSICKKKVTNNNNNNNNNVKVPGFVVDEYFTMAELGRLGEECLKLNAELTPDTKVFMTSDLLVIE